MIFYDKNGKKYKYIINEYNYFDKGTSSKIYRINYHYCLKVINKDSKKHFNQEVYNEIKSLSLEGLVKLGIPFFEGGIITSYTLRYVKRCKKSILDMPIEYTLESLNILYKSIYILAGKHIITNDLYYRNLIEGPSIITMIDFDDYVKLIFDDDILYRNICFLLGAFKGLYYKALENDSFYSLSDMIENITIGDYLDYLFDFNDCHNEEPSLVLKRKLENVKTPRELFNKKNQK